VLIDPTPIAQRTIGCAINVHRRLGPGLLESAYASCLFRELVVAGLAVEREVPVPVLHRGQSVKNAYRADFVIEGELLVEVKSIEALTRLHTSQVLTYLKLLQLRQGLLMNFNVRLLKNGLRRVLL